MEPEQKPNSDIIDSRPRETTREYGKRLWVLLARYGKRSDVFKSKDKVDRVRPDLKPMTKPWVLIALQLFPGLLIITFVLSFFWDFNGVVLSISSLNIQMDGILRIISVSGLIGFGTNWLAITMLFRPEHKRPLLGHGLIPSQKKVIAFRLAQAVSTDLINPELIQKKISESRLIPVFRDKSIDYLRGITDNQDFRDELKSLTVSYMHDLVADPEIRSSLAANILTTLEKGIASKKLEKLALQTYLMVRGSDAQEIIEKAIASMPDNIEKLLDKVDQILDAIPEKLEERADWIEKTMTQLLYSLVNQLDVHTLIEENVNRFEEKRLEKMIKGATNEQLRYIQYLGAVLGTIGGLVIWSPLLSLSILVTLTLIILGIDTLLGNRAESLKR